MAASSTEGAFSDAYAASSLRRACDLGFTVAMNDFGVGSSSLSQLPRLPITTVKLDRSFITEAMENECGARPLASIAQLARGLNLKVVAEGGETPAQLALVDEVGCNAVQGYFYARPMTPEAFQGWLLQRVTA
jgi:EAL domain-containing protein (putative c-di-GMP-specific phosphodiesterase class I)